jgi:hypothetical protein
MNERIAFLNFADRCIKSGLDSDQTERAIRVWEANSNAPERAQHLMVELLQEDEVQSWI